MSIRTLRYLKGCSLPKRLFLNPRITLVSTVFSKSISNSSSSPNIESKSLPPIIQIPLNSLYESPVSSIIAFFIIFELTGMLTFMGSWYGYYHYPILNDHLNLIEFFQSDPSLLERSTKTVESVLQNTTEQNVELSKLLSFDEADEELVIKSGLNAYFVSKLSLPFRAILGFFGMNWVNNFFVKPTARLFQRKNSSISEVPKKKVVFKKVVKKRI